MSKGYVVANIRVEDQEKFKQFSGMAGPTIKKYGGKLPNLNIILVIEE